MHKPADGIAESLHAYVSRARLTVCEVSVFSKEISQLSKILLPLLLLRRYFSLWAYFREITVLEKAYSAA